jgi:esterase/lipase superfamily enzyme
MQREYRCWYSAHLQRDIELLIFGYAAMPLLAFPPCQGRFFDWEHHGMVAPLGDHLKHARLHLYCADSIDGESWFAQCMLTARPIGRNQIGRLDRLRNTKRLRALQSCPV